MGKLAFLYVSEKFLPSRRNPLSLLVSARTEIMELRIFFFEAFLFPAQKYDLVDTLK